MRARTGILSASSGNASSAIAAYCAAAGLKCVILMEPGNPPAKLRQTLATGAQVVLVEGVFAHGPPPSPIFSARQRRRPISISVSSGHPSIPTSSKASKRLPTKSPRAYPARPMLVIAPVGGGDMFAAQWRGYQELLRAKVIEHLPRMIGVQSESAPPLIEAVRAGASTVATLPYARSKISGINVPFTGDHALAAVRDSGGTAVGVTDESVWAMQRRLALGRRHLGRACGRCSRRRPANLDRARRHSPRRAHRLRHERRGLQGCHSAAEQADRIGQQPTTPFDVGAVVAQIQSG